MNSNCVKGAQSKEHGTLILMVTGAANIPMHGDMHTLSMKIAVLNIPQILNRDMRAEMRSRS
jgi:hypothetical protein